VARCGVRARRVFGVSMAAMKKLAARFGASHELAAGLWATGWHEARILAAFVEEPERVTPAQMDRWCRDFDNWAICDTVCFHLFDRTPHAFRKVAQWSRRREEFVKRAAFALLASVALHDKSAADERFLRCLPLVERAATDDRNFVRKGVSWGLRGVGRRSFELHAAAVEVARRLSASPESAARWVGKDALRDLARPTVIRRLTAERPRT
jgi:3-methyladenine DNA glycosylase AlkD